MEKMAVENVGESQEAEALIKKDAQDGGKVIEGTDSKLILYHWTQSFSSQKVRNHNITSHLCVESSRITGWVLWL